MNLESIKRIFEQVKTKNIYCWGSGKYFRNHTLPFLHKSGLIDHYKGFADRSKLMLLPKEDTQDTLVLISVTGYREILSQLQANPKLSQFIAIPAMLLEALYEDMAMLSAPKPPANFRKNRDITIPRTIHTFWFSEKYMKQDEYAPCDVPDEDLPDRYRACLESWRKYAPDFEIKIWNQNSYHAENCLFYEQAIEKKCWAFASDYARADVLRRFGGVYMDLDVEMLRPVDDLLYNDAFMSFESLSRIECGSGMGATAGNKILDEICKDYESRPFIKDDGSLDLSTCPVRFTKVIEKHGLVKNGGFQMVEDITIYPFEVLTGKSFDTGIIYSTEYSYTLHHHNGSWVPEHTQRAMDNRYLDIENLFC